MRIASEWAPRAPRWCDAAADLTVVLLATWTVVYHVCLVARLDAETAVVLELGVLAATALAWWALRRREAPRLDVAPRLPEVGGPAWEEEGGRGRSKGPTRLEWLTVALVLLAAIAFAVKAPWPVTATLWILASVGGVAVALNHLRSPVTPDGTGPAGSVPTLADTVVALGWALAMAIVALVALRPNPDDLYYVNMSQWVVDHGSFPLRDTIFSNQVFPMSSWPPIASYDGLVGALARLAHVQAGSVAYVVVPPIATALAVLALWRLLRAWSVRPLWLALSVALVFLLFDGGAGYATPGNLFVTRLWQGKVILAAFLLPTLLVHALRYVDRPTRARGVWLFVCGVAGVGLSTSAMFVVPLVGLVGVAPLAVRDRWRTLAGFAAVSIYPVAAGVTTVLLHGHSADDFAVRRLYRFDPAWFGHQIFSHGPLALVTVAAVLAGPFVVPRRAARLTSALAALVVGITFLPGFTGLTYDLVGLGPTLWRVSWVLPVAALVGIAATRLASAQRVPRWVARAGPVLLVALIVVSGTATLSGASGVVLKSPTAWERPADSRGAAHRVISDSAPGDVVLAPRDLAISIDVATTRIKTVAPRDYFMAYLRGAPGFHYPARLRLYNYANSVAAYLPPASRLLSDLRQVGVDTVCLNRDQRRARAILVRAGFTAHRVSSTYVCLQPS